LEFRSLSSVPSLAKFIESRLVIDRDFIGEIAQVADCFGPSFDKGHVRVHISFAPNASEGTSLTIVH
jgi:hypothetical protein